MNAHRIRVGIGVGLMATLMTVGVASAQTLEGSSHSGGGGGGGGSRRTTATTRAGEVLPQSETSVPPAEAPTLAFTDDAPAPASAPATGGSLPFTGGDIAGMVLLGGGALAAGAVMVRRSRPQTA